MSSACDLCTRKLSTPFNLKRHLHLCHNIPKPTTTRKHNGVRGWSQIGAGASNMDSEDSDDGDDDDSERDDNNDDEESEEDMDSDEEENTDDNSVFNRFLKNIDSGHALVDRQAKFRAVYGKR